MWLSSVAESSTVGEGGACDALAAAPLRLLKNWPIMSGTGRMKPDSVLAGAGRAAVEGVANSNGVGNETTHCSQLLPGRETSVLLECSASRVDDGRWWLVAPDVVTRCGLCTITGWGLRAGVCKSVDTAEK